MSFADFVRLVFDTLAAARSDHWAQILGLTETWDAIQERIAELRRSGS